MTAAEKTPPARLFISYAHSDGAELASRLAADLQGSGFIVWWDRERLKPGASWTAGIEVGLDEADVVLCILSQGSYGSDICRAEQLRALRKHKRVLPILLQKDADLPIHLETEQYIAFYTGYEAGFERLTTAIGNASISASLLSKYKKRYRTFPPLPIHFVPRVQLVERLRKAIIKEGGRRSTPITAIRGMGGIGKSVLAQAVCHDEAVQDAFPDGVLWVTIGERPSNDHLCAQIRELAKAMGDPLEGYDTLYGCENQLRMTLSNKSVLIVLDDVWDPRHVKYFHAEAPRCRLLLTTRSQEVVRGTDAEEFAVEVMEAGESMELLASKSGLAVSDLPEEASEIIERCGFLPLGLAMLGARAAKGRDEWTRILRALKEGKALKTSQRLSDYPYRNLFEAIQVSVDSLSEDQRSRYLDLAIFPPDTPIPAAVLEGLWSMDAGESEETIDVWLEASLATRDTSGAVMLHDLQLDYVRSQATNLEELNRRLLNAYKAKLFHGWGSGPDDGYYFGSLAYHLQEAGESKELRELLLSPDWLQTKLDRGSISSLIGDYEFLPNDPEVRMIQQALQLSAYVLDKDPKQLASQLFGRLRSIDLPEIQAFLEKVGRTQRRPWIEPLCCGLWKPGTLLLFTLAGHLLQVNAVAVSGDGRRAVSGSADRTLKVWNLDTGLLLRTLVGHADSINAVAVTPDGKQAVSASYDKTLRVWNLDSGLEVFQLTGHTDVVNAIAIPQNVHQAVSCSDDHTVRVWNLTTGEEIHTLTGHAAQVATVVLTPDGTRAVSASFDCTLRVWDLAAGTAVHNLVGHSRSVTAAAITSDGKYVVSASSDHTLKIWELEQGKEIRTLTGHSGCVNAVSITPDGSKILSASHDRTLKMWDLQTGTELHSFSGHAQRINVLAITKDGSRAISASPDHTVKVWDLKTGTELRTLTVHSGAVSAMVITPDGSRALTASDDSTLRVWKTGTSWRRAGGHSNMVSALGISEDGKLAVSASHDKTLKVWDLEGRSLIHTLVGHSDAIDDLVVRGDGRQAVSASQDKTLKVWDLATGTLLYSLQGHSSAVTRVAVTPDWRYAASLSLDKVLKIWDLLTHREVSTLLLHREETPAATTPKVGPSLEKKPRGAYGPSESRIALAITPDAKRLVAARSEQLLHICDLEQGAELHELSGHSGTITDIVISGDSKQVISSSCDATVKVWDLGDGREVRTLSGHSGSVTHLAITSNGARVISASTDKTIKTWDLGSSDLLYSFAAFVSPVVNLAVSPDGERVICVSENEAIKVWSRAGEEIATFAADGSITCFAVGTDGRTIVAGDYLGRVHLLRLHEEQAAGTLDRAIVNQDH